MRGSLRKKDYVHRPWAEAEWAEWHRFRSSGNARTRTKHFLRSKNRVQSQKDLGIKQQVRKASSSSNQSETIANQTDPSSQIIDLFSNSNAPNTAAEEDEAPPSTKKCVPARNLHAQPPDPANLPNRSAIPRSNRVRKRCHEEDGFDCNTFSQIESHVWESQTIVPGMSVAFKRVLPSNGCHDYLRVKYVLREIATNKIWLRGLVFRLNRHANQTWLDDEPLYEVAMIANVVRGDCRPFDIQGLESIPLEGVKGIADVVLSASAVPGRTFMVAQAVTSKTTVVCRIIEIREYRNIHLKAAGSKPQGGVLRRVRTEEADEPTITASHNPSSHIPRRTCEKEIVYGDVCHGIGGAAKAAHEAGMKVTWGVDKDPLRHESCQQNFPRMNALCEDVFDFPRYGYDLKADVLHFSFPCKYWSQAKTTTGKDDELNKKILFETATLIDIVKPRHVSFEQVDGLHKLKKHYPYFQRLVYDIFALGYNVSWTVINFKDYGIPAERNRLMLAAAAPGEYLPKFPAPTHGLLDSGLKPYVGVEASLRGLQRSALHKPELMPRMATGDYDPAMPLPATFICKGPGLPHWRGREFTVAEQMRIQGLTDDHKICGTDWQKTRQMGDAVPTKGVVPFFKEIVRTIQDTDSRAEHISRSPYEEPVCWSQEQESSQPSFSLDGPPTLPSTPNSARFRSSPEGLPDWRSLFTKPLVPGHCTASVGNSRKRLSSFKSALAPSTSRDQLSGSARGVGTLLDRLEVSDVD